MDIVRAAAEIVVGVPVDIGGEHRNIACGSRLGYDPREGDEGPRFALGMK